MYSVISRNYLSRRVTIVAGFIIICMSAAQAQFTRQDTLRGTLGGARLWWNVTHYDITVEPDYAKKSIAGTNIIGFEATANGHVFQIDLQDPMQIDEVKMHTCDKKKKQKDITVKGMKREGNVYFISIDIVKKGTKGCIEIKFSGTPVAAKNPPWDGGWIWSKDSLGRPWMSVACQGRGASVWYPCKDHQSDEPDNGANLTIIVPDTLVAVANGRNTQTKKLDGNRQAWTWTVKNPINNYNIIPSIGKYVTWKEDFKGEKGDLSINYWVLDYNLARAKQQFARDVPRMLKCFEYWFGPYPFYEDGYKLVESPHLGMEHQSAVAYGNRYKNGYLGMDLSGTGWGQKFDFIIVHESGHEWFGNNITTADIADMWVHEGFTNYSEALFVECEYGKEAGNEYCQGVRRGIRNDIPIIGSYGVNSEGSGDMYPKGANLIHTIRQLIDDDEKFRQILRGLNKDFWHSTTTSKEVEGYISRKSGIDLHKVFDQYLRNTSIPELQYRVSGNKVSCRWAKCIDGFDMPVRLANGGQWIQPTTDWKTFTISNPESGEFKIDKNFYIRVKQVTE